MIRQFGDPILRSVCSEVTQFNDALQEKIIVMKRIMEEAGGVGLAAPQVGSLQRMLIYRLPGDDGPSSSGELQVLINPEWVSAGMGEQPALEGCLSLPGIQLPVVREVAIHVTAQDPTGGKVEFLAEDLEARIIQHETDHLNGKLILEHVSPEIRREAILTINQYLGS